jgi:hypothetical protein
MTDYAEHTDGSGQSEILLAKILADNRQRMMLVYL